MITIQNWRPSILPFWPQADVGGGCRPLGEARSTAGVYQRRPDHLSLCLRRVCHQQRGQAVGHFDVSTVLLCCNSTVLHDPAIVVGNRLRRRPPLSKNPSRTTGRMRASTERHHPPPLTAEHHRRYPRRLMEKGLKEASCHFYKQ